ncbi:hypothetical protein ACQ4PT_000669 [Festuca glaucescens]
MAPPSGDASPAGPAALDLAVVHILEASSLPPLPERGGNAAPRKEECEKNKDRKEKGGAPRITGWGLREYSKIVCEKVEAKGRTTYNEVSSKLCILHCLAIINHFLFDEKNIRRRVYDAFNVLIALRVIAKEKKEIKWMGLSNYRIEKMKKLEEVRRELINRIRNKKKLLQEIEKQFDDLQHIKSRNQTLQRSAENANGIRLPFVLVKTSQKATVEIEISEDSKFVRFEFNGAPFTLHDDLSILEGVRPLPMLILSDSDCFQKETPIHATEDKQPLTLSLCSARRTGLTARKMFSGKADAANRCKLRPSLKHLVSWSLPNDHFKEHSLQKRLPGKGSPAA